MVDILPFRGLRYNLDKLAAEGASLSDVVTPPYDVIDARMQEAFCRRHPANFVRLDFGLKSTEDTERDNVYTRAARWILDWEGDGTLIPEPAPAFYAYSQQWEEQERTVLRKGLIALLRLEEYETGGVLPHEHTLKGPKADRMQLMQTTLCGLSQVFLIYSDPDRLMEGLLHENPAAHLGWAQATDQDGIIHRFRPMTDPDVLTRLQVMFKEKTLLIADGHHRYETALAFAREVRDVIRRKTGQDPTPGSLLSDYGMVFLTNMDDPGLKVYPTHRLLYRWPEGWDQARFEEALYARYERAGNNPTFLYRPAGSSERIPLRLKAQVRPDLPPLLDQFDAALLAETVFQDVLGSSQEQLKSEHLLGFYRDETEMDRLWDTGEAVAGFYLSAPSVSLVHRICESGHRMPQKSTYFYPKILSGLVIQPYRPFADGSGHALSGVAPVEPLPADFRFPQAVFSQRPY